MVGRVLLLILVLSTCWWNFFSHLFGPEYEIDENHWTSFWLSLLCCPILRSQFLNIWRYCVLKKNSYFAECRRCPTSWCGFYGRQYLLIMPMNPQFHYWSISELSDVHMIINYLKTRISLNLSGVLVGILNLFVNLLFFRFGNDLSQRSERANKRNIRLWPKYCDKHSAVDNGTVMSRHSQRMPQFVIIDSRK